MAKAAMQWRTASAAVAATTAMLAFPALAFGHLERPSYWPDPAPDKSSKPAAGGKVPSARSLSSAVTGSGPGEVLVVFQGRKGKDSLDALRASLNDARRHGYRLRPSQSKTEVSGREASKLLKINRERAKQCKYDSVQKAVWDAGNNDRIVILPGTYEEPESRSKPENDPKCVPSLLQKDASGDLTPSYRYQVTCPNDQNLIYVQGRALAGDPPEPPLSNRQGIPAQELGPCVRCNLQIEGSGVKPEDVILDGGTDYQGDGPTAKPGGYAKDVVMRVDRADGFVGRNFLARGAAEHGFYNEEVDGILLDRVKFFWGADYGHLSFSSDHNLVQNCEGFGAGDAAVYPGAAPETGSQATTGFYKDAPRYNTTIRKCDMHGSGLGYSGSMGNAVRITNNHIYGNVTGIASDTLSAAGHPGFPADSSKIDHNFIYANNLDLYVENPPVDPLVSVPIGVGVLYAGMNDARVHDNWIFDNWRNGAMLFSIPDALTNGGGPEGDVYPGVSCPGAPQNGFSTSCGNQFYDNHMGRAPRGFRYPASVDMYPGANAHAENDGRRAKPNGTDFWWGEFFRSNTANCWFDNKGWDGTEASVTGPGEAGLLPAAQPQVLPSDCGTSLGNDDAAKLGYLVECSNGPDDDTGPNDCDWWRRPAQPVVPATDGAGGGTEDEATAEQVSTASDAAEATQGG